MARQQKIYTKRMSAEELVEHFSRSAEYDLLDHCNVVGSRLTVISHGGDGSARPISVEGTDGVAYGGVEKAEYHWQRPDNPRLVARFALGENQDDASGLDKRMAELGFKPGKTILVRG